MIIDNILYTPLVCPSQPVYSLDAIKEWAVQNSSTLHTLKEQLADEGHISERVENNYPWDVQVAYRKFDGLDPGWVGEFDTKFPELAKYFYEAFGLTLDDLGIVLFLPVKADNLGIGFWHKDPDGFGLRMYLEYEDYQNNTLLIRALGSTENKVCRPVSNKQCFFLNNISAVHTTYTSVPNKTRVAVLIIGKLDAQSQIAWKEKIKSLVESSADAYPDYVVTL